MPRKEHYKRKEPHEDKRQHNKPPLHVVRAIRADYKVGVIGWGIDAVSKLHKVPEWIVKDIIGFKTVWSRTIDPMVELAPSESEESMMDRIENALRKVPCAKAHEITRLTGIRRVQSDRLISLLLQDERIHEIKTYLKDGHISPCKAYAAGPTPDIDAIFDKYAEPKVAARTDWPRGQHGRDVMVAAFFGPPIEYVASMYMEAA